MRTARTFTVCRSLLLGGGGLPAWFEGGCVCTCLVPGGVPSWSRGVYLPGPGGCTWLGGVPAWSWGGVPGPREGVPAWSGGCTCLVWGGVPAWSRGGVPAWSGGCTCLVWGVYLPGLGGGGCTWSGIPPLWTEWHTLMKILPCPKLRLRAVIILLACFNV